MASKHIRVDRKFEVSYDSPHPTYNELAVVFKGDGEPKTPAGMIGLLSDIAASDELEMDSYSLGGSVEKLEKHFAEMLAKEAAIFMPTGTLANHIALRTLCGHKPRAIVQHEGHQYNDTGDSAALLSGINLLPIAEGRPYFTLSELSKTVERLESGRVATPLGAVMIESPVRRKYGQLMPYDEMAAVTKFCAERGIGTHLDAARLYMMTAATGISPQAYTELFDTVYVSLYKYFGSPYGAVLAGKSVLIDDLYHQRRMFGGSLASACLAAALAIHGSLDFEERFGAAMSKAIALFELLNKLNGINISAYEHGSNVFPMTLDSNVKINVFQNALREKSVFVFSEEHNTEPLHLTVNTTILRVPNEDLVRIFAFALAKGKDGVTTLD